MNFTVNPIGKVNAEEGFSIQVDSKYRTALTGLEGFSYVQVISGLMTVTMQ